VDGSDGDGGGSSDDGVFRAGRLGSGDPPKTIAEPGGHDLAIDDRYVYFMRGSDLMKACKR
jgi:hypothetical protein